MGRKVNLVGLRFSRLKVVSEAQPYKSPSGRLYIMWNCICDCGNTTVVRSSALKPNGSKSCGCFSADSTKERATTHGMTRTPTYTSYRAMVKRCSNPNDPAYAQYGGRGIQVCERWKISFENFLADMGLRPKRRTLDRIETNGNYEPGNCRWATKSEQQLNRRPQGGTSRMRGVCWSTMYQCFVAQVGVGIKNKKIGNFKCEFKAAEAYDAFIIKHNLPNKLNEPELYPEGYIKQL